MKNFQSILLEQIALFFKPIRDFEKEPEKLFAFLKSIGYHIEEAIESKEEILEQAKVLSNSAKKILKTLSDKKINTIVQEIPWPEGIDLPAMKQEINLFPENMPQLNQTIQQTSPYFKDFIKAIKSLTSKIKETKIVNSKEYIDQLGHLPKRMLEGLTFHYLHNKSSAILPFLEIITLIKNKPFKELNISDKVVIIENALPVLQLNKVEQLLNDPKNLFKEEYWPGISPFSSKEKTNQISQKIFERVQYFLNSCGIESGVYPVRSLEDVVNLNQSNSFFSFTHKFYDANYEHINYAGVSFELLSATDKENGPGINCYPYGETTFNDYIGNVNLVFNSNINSDGIQITKDGISISSSEEENQAELIIHPFHSDLVVGTTKGTRFEIKDLKVENKLIAKSGKKPTISSYLTIPSFKLIISPKDADNFLSKIIKKDGFEIDSKLKLGWSHSNGFHFEGSTDLSLEMAVDKKVGPLTFNTFLFELKPNQDSISFESKTSFKTKLKKFEVGIEGLGLSSKFTFPKKGEFGKIAFDIAPPKGISLAISTKKIKGAGYLYIDPDNDRYAGALEFNFKNKVNFQVIGILNTQLPDSDTGYSLLLMITADGFRPIDLGMGFKLIGIGGLMGLHRTINTDVLRKGIKEDTLDNILFPSDPVKNAFKIIADMESAFPIQEGSFVFGPMTKITWGSKKPLLNIELGLFIKIPDPIIAIAGVVKSMLPLKENGKRKLLRIQVNFLGFIDFTEKMISFDASIFDSSFAKFTLSGDMAFRLVYGDNPNFLLSIGGFHPKFEPPPLKLPPLRRLIISLINEKKSVVQLESYFAITSNTVQFGVKAIAKFKAMNREVVGIMGFDVLFQFNPFRFSFDAYLLFAVYKNGEEKGGINISIHLEGPSPWYISGTAEAKVLGIKLKVDFEKTFGKEQVTLPPSKVKISPLLKEALADIYNWEIVNPSHMKWVRFRQTKEELVVLPGATIRFTQQVVPLNTRIDHFGQSAPDKANEFSINITSNHVKPKRENLTPHPQGYFPVSHFFTISDSEKLTKPSFEHFDNGVEVLVGTSSQIERSNDEITVGVEGILKNLLGDKKKKPATRRVKSRSVKSSSRILRKTKGKYFIANTKNLLPYLTESYSYWNAKQKLKELVEKDPKLKAYLQLVPAQNMVTFSRRKKRSRSISNTSSRKKINTSKAFTKVY